VNEREQRIEELFLEALEREVDERAAFVRSRCGDDTLVADEVLDLLGHHGSGGDLLDGLPAELSPGALAPDDELEGAPEAIGPYRIERVLGRGGFGVVYLAHQLDPVRRKVALKVVKRGMDTEQVVRRFRAEQQALALLDHPGVAKVYDAGATPDGRPYFAMEYVPGVPITEYCDTHRLSTDARLALFLGVCAAVQHAHQKGILHRDLKPANILVRVREDGPVPVVIDFGLAKAIHVPLLDEAPATRPDHFVGTPEFASPEQLRSDGLDVDTRADVYSLGVVLYHLLTGELPLAARGRGRHAYFDLQRLVCEVEPAPPSQRVSSSERSGESARLRQTDPLSLTRALRGDIDRIVLKALDKDRTRRYASASELGADIERHLAHEPVLAAGRDTLYTLRKFVRRHRAMVGAGVALLVSLTAGLVGSALGWRRALRAEAAAREELSVSRAIDDHLTRVLSGADPWAAGDAERGRETRVVDVLALASREAARSFAALPRVEAEVRRTIGQNLHLLGQLSEAESELRRALELSLRELGPDDERTVRTRSALANTLRAGGQAAEAERHGREVLAWYRAHQPANESAILHEEQNLATLAWMQGRVDEAEASMRELAARCRRELGPEHRQTLEALYDLASLGYGKGEIDEAVELLEEVHATTLRVHGARHPGTIDAAVGLGGVLVVAGRRDEAERLLTEALAESELVHGERHPVTLTALNNLGELLKRKGELERARELLARAVAIGSEVRGARHSATLDARLNLALLDRMAGDLPGAERQLAELWEAGQEVYGADQPQAMVYASQLATTWTELGRFEQAEALLRRVVAVHEAASGPNAAPTLAARNDLGYLLVRSDRLDEARAVLEDALARGRASLTPGDRRVLDSLEVLRGLHEAAGRPQEAQAMVEQAEAWVVAAGPAAGG